jgi:hypothetical protein
MNNENKKVFTSQEYQDIWNQYYILENQSVSLLEEHRYLRNRNEELQKENAKLKAELKVVTSDTPPAPVFKKPLPPAWSFKAPAWIDTSKKNDFNLRQSHAEEDSCYINE